MKRKSFYILIYMASLFSVNILLAQNNDLVTVKGSAIEIAIENRTHKFYDQQKSQFIIRDYYEFTDESSSGHYKLPHRDVIIALPSDSRVKVSLISSNEKKINNIVPSLNPEVELVNDSTVSAKEVDYQNRKQDLEFKPLIENKGYFWLRDFYCVRIRINSHKYDERTSTLTEVSDIVLSLELDKAVSILRSSPLQNKTPFDENLKLVISNHQIAEQFRGNPKLVLSENTGNWINYSANYLKIGTGSDGLFRIPKSYFDNYGISTTGINPKTFQLFESGIEKPIYVFGENDLTFDNGDYIEFYGTKNYSKISARVINANNMPYNNYLDKYTDTTMYFLTWGTQNGKRAEEINVFQPSVTDSLTYYTSFTHSEENATLKTDALFYTFSSDLIADNFPFWETSKGWYWNWVATWSKPSTTISAADIIPNKTAKFFAKVVSRKCSVPTNGHLLKLLLNNATIDSQVTNRYQRVLLQGSVSSNAIISGNNTLKIDYYEVNGADKSDLLLDWFEAEYPRKLKLINSHIYFEYQDLTGTSLKVIKIENVPNSNYVLFKIKPSFKRITSFNLVGTNLVFTDTVSNGDAYFLIQQNTYSLPKFYAYKTFVNLRSQNPQVDYIGITHPDFQSSVNNYLNFVSSNFAVTTSLYSVNDIFDEFGYGYPTAESIREFLILKFQNSPAPKPSYLVLFGDANYDFKKYRTTQQGRGNFVPSHGFPVSDPFYAIWDSVGVRLPQMYVGRIPLNNSSEMDFYKSKVQNNLLQPFDEWNKKYLFFSGGPANYPDQIAFYKSINDSVINNFIVPPSLSGNYKHFYKTTTPFSDFGPYSESEIYQATAGGGVLISYIGHSGIATWDNSISDVFQLKNTVNRNPVITDFGCSTNKFAEPDIIAFGERFIVASDGQALGYIGNSALGFVSTASKGPGNFFKYVVQDTMFQVGKAHYYTKYLMYQQMGSSNSTQEFSFANTLLGDPIVKIKIPNRPNLSIKSSDVSFTTEFINDAMDSVELKVSVNNLGTIIPQTFKLYLNHSYHGSTVDEFLYTLSLPQFKDTISFWIRVKKKAGQHNIVINLDTENSVVEIYENDNNLNFQFNVSSATIRDILVNRHENPVQDSLIVLNPSSQPEKQLSLTLQQSNTESFLNPIESGHNLDTFFTKINFSTPLSNNRTWLRYKLSSETEWSNPLSYSKLSGLKYFIGDNYSWNRQDLSDLQLNSDTIKLSKDTINISILSAGSYSGQYCIIKKNGINLLSNTFFEGIGVVVFDEKTFDVESSNYYQMMNNSPGVTECTNFINSIPPNKLVALGVAGDATNNWTEALRTAVTSLGGSYFSSLQFKAPYALLGKKNASPSQVKQVIKTAVQGSITLDTISILPFSSGTLVTTQIGPSSSWNKLKVGQTNQNDSEIKYRPLGIRNDGTVDTLSYLTLTNNEANLSSISAFTYPYLKIKSEFKSDSLFNSPKLSRLEVGYKGVAELGTSYQVVSLNKDSVIQGEKSKVTFYVYNSGEAKASNFKVQVDVIRPDNSSETVLEQYIDSIGAGQRRLLGAGFITEFEAGDRTYKINIDSDNQILEYFEDNNVFYKPFFIKRDTTKPVIIVLFNGGEIMDGDYVAPKPIIRIEVNDPSHIPIANNPISINLDNRQVSLEKNSGNISYEYNSENPKLVVEYQPDLEEGEHTLSVLANNQFRNFGDTLGFQKRFVVSNTTEISKIFNVPNPIIDGTHFTFELASVLPDEIQIMVYTIAGRLIKKLVIPRGELKQNFNKFFWDTRDEDGNLLSNGTYLYKVIMNAGDKSETSVHKLAITR